MSGRPALLVTCSTLIVALAGAREVTVIPLSARRVTERLPRSIDLERFLFGFGQHVFGSTAVFVWVQQPNFDAPGVSDRIEIRR
jgi:hypothetical protein